MDESPGVLDQRGFERLVRDALANLYDQAALETHALADFLPSRPQEGKSRAEQLGELLLGAIEKLRPAARALPSTAPEMRPYALLHGRYVRGLSLQELGVQLGLSVRQLRREQRRAVQAVASFLWDQIGPGRKAKGAQVADLGQAGAFTITQETLALSDVMHGVLATLQARVRSVGTALRVSLPPQLPAVLSDRVVLRQILLSLLSYALELCPGGPVAVSAEAQAEDGVSRVRVVIEFEAGERVSVAQETQPLAIARYWAERLDARLDQEHLALGEGRFAVRLTLTLPTSQRPLLLVVDDQEPAVRMFQLYLSQTAVQVVGVQDGVEALTLARQLRPQAIILDVMMPTMDGWEVLQALQTDPRTASIPVIVCSVWDEPELAFSLGAADFLKKPVARQDLLAALARLGLVPADSWAEWHPAAP